MDLARPGRDDWPAALYYVGLALMPALIVLQWLQRSCSLAGGCGDVAAWHLVVGLALGFVAPAAAALALHRGRPLGGRVGRRLPAEARGHRIAAGALALFGATVGLLLLTPTTLLAAEGLAAGPLVLLLLPLHAAAWAATLAGDAVPGIAVTAVAVLVAAVAGPWLVAVAAVLDGVWRRSVAVAGERGAVAAAALLCVAAVGSAGALHVDVPYGRHVTWAEPAATPAPPAALTDASARNAAARHAAASIRNDLLETQGLHGDRRVSAVTVDCSATRVLARDPDAVYVEVHCFPEATVVATPWATERYSGPLRSHAATYAVRRDGVARVEAPVVGRHLLAPGRDLAGVDLSDADLSRIDLHGAVLRGADLTGADLSATNLSGARLRNASLRHATVDVTDLRGADLAGADLRNASFDARIDRSTRLVGADLRGATVAGHPSLAGIDARRARFDGAALGSGIAAAAANLSSARLGNASFVDAQMRQVTLDGAALRDAALGGAMLYRASFRGADARGADLSGADLGLADLRGADLRDADLRDARLWGADLRDADLRGARLDGSRWREAWLEGALLPDGASR